MSTNDNPALAPDLKVWHDAGQPQRLVAGFPDDGDGVRGAVRSGTLLKKTHKPFKVWFRAIFEVSTRRTGISPKDLQRILGFGSYRTAWAWLHKLRAAMVRSDGEPLGPFVQIDEALVGGKGGAHKELVLVAAETGRWVRLAHFVNRRAKVDA